MANVAAVPSSGQLTVGGGRPVSITPFTCPMLSGVSIYVHGHTAPTIGRVVSWNPVISVEAPVVPIFPLLMTVLIPMLVIPAEPPKPPNGARTPRLIGGLHVDVPIVKVQGFGGGPVALTSSPMPNISVAPS